MFQSLTEQGDNKDIRNYCKPRYRLYSILLTMLSIIWLFSSLILSKSFNGLLLNSFFNIKFSPVVNTLEDIRNDKKITIYGIRKELSTITKTLHFDIDHILKRIPKIEENFNLTNSIELVAQEKAVMLINSLTKRTCMEIFDFYKERIHVSDKKYLPNFAIFIVHKKREYTKIIHY